MRICKMAAVLRLSSGKFIVRQVALVRMFSAAKAPSSFFRIPSITCTGRFRCSAPTVDGGDSKKPPSASSSPDNNNTYKVEEYFSYNEYSFYDLENVIDSSGRRQIQPDPKVKYNHTDPWTTKEKSAA